MIENHHSFFGKKKGWQAKPPPKEPKKKPPPKPADTDHIYRVLLDAGRMDHIVDMPFKTADVNYKVHVIHNQVEYELTINKGEVLPKIFRNNNNGLIIRFHWDDFFGA